MSGPDSPSDIDWNGEGVAANRPAGEFLFRQASILGDKNANKALADIGRAETNQKLQSFVGGFLDAVTISPEDAERQQQLTNENRELQRINHENGRY